MSWSELAMSGWDVFPLPPMRKGPPPKGVTGEDGVNPCESIWESVDKDANVGIRLPANVIGLDFDLYRGETLFISLQKRLGALPPSWGISNRDNPLSEGFTAFFIVPEGIKWRGGWSNMDIIHRDLRYTVAPPSIHPSGRAYKWFHFPTGVTPSHTPTPEDLPELPEAWVSFLSKPEESEVKDTDQLELGFTLSERDSGQLCPVMRKAMGSGLKGLKSVRGSRHDFAVKLSWRLVQLRAQGHGGYSVARRAVTSQFAKAVLDKRSQEEAANEARQLFISAEKKIKTVKSTCSCGRGERYSNGSSKVSRALFR